jgi:hypothetical protein
MYDSVLLTYGIRFQTEVLFNNSVCHYANIASVATRPPIQDPYTQHGIIQSKHKVGL